MSPVAVTSMIVLTLAAAAASVSPLVMTSGVTCPARPSPMRTLADEDALAQAEAKRRRKNAARLRGAA